MCWLRIWNAGATREGLKTESSTQRPDKLDEVKSRQKETDQSCWLHPWLMIRFSRVLFQWWGLRLFSDTDGQMRRSIKWRDLLRSNNIATSNQRFSLDSTAVSTFVIMLVELTNTVFVNSTNITRNIETTALSMVELWIIAMQCIASSCQVQINVNDVTLADEDGTQNLLILFMIDDVDEDHTSNGLWGHPVVQH